MNNLLEGCTGLRTHQFAMKMLIRFIWERAGTGIQDSLRNYCQLDMWVQIPPFSLSSLWKSIYKKNNDPIMPMWWNW